MRTETKLIKTKLGLINLAEQLGNVSQACRMMGYSRICKRFHRTIQDEGSTPCKVYDGD